MSAKTKPILLAVDDDTDALAIFKLELSKRYGDDYRILCESSVEAGIKALEEFRAAHEDVAVVLADQWISGDRQSLILPEAD